jgi:hypothetical protein
MKQIQLKIKISLKNYVYHQLNYIVQVNEKKRKVILIFNFYFILVLAEDAIKAAIHDYNTKKINKKQQ